MPDQGTITRELDELDECLSRVPLPGALESRILGAIEAAPPRRAAVRLLALAALAFAAGIVVAIALFERPTAERDDAANPQSNVATAEPSPRVDDGSRTVPGWPGLSILDEHCTWSRDAGAIELGANCRAHLAEPTMNIEVWRTARLEPARSGVRVRHGLLAFSVDKITSEHGPARVAVSGGVIEVLGTRFVVDQREHGGHVDLIEGTIQFRQHDDSVDAVVPGQRHLWTTPRPPTPNNTTIDAGHAPLRPSTGEPHELSAERADLTAGLAEVARRRRRGDDASAIAKLDELARAPLGRRAHEVISYERGTLVERSSSTDAACEAWSGHQRRFPSGRYDADIARRMLQLKCPRR